MNTYSEHQVKLGARFRHAACPDASSLTDSRARAGCHRHGQDHLLAPPADSGPAGPHGRPHQLRALSGLQQLHLRVSVSQQPRAMQTCACLAGWKNLAKVGTSGRRWHGGSPTFGVALISSRLRRPLVPAVWIRPVSMSRPTSAPTNHSD